MENGIAEFQTGIIKPVQTEAVISRQAQEVQAAMVIAKKFPRDEAASYSRIIKACGRKTLAEAAVYEYPRGGAKVSGPSIRLAEVLAQNWGNIDSGIVELEQRNGESTVLAYSWDLETNTRSSKVFQVKHERKSNGKITVLTDPRDIYEMVANQGARRLRACILSTMPGDIIDAAVNKCEETMKQGESEPLSDRIRKMVTVFDSEFNVSIAMLESRFGHKIEAISETEMVSLKKIYRSLKDGMGSVEDFFNKPAADSKTSSKFTTEKKEVKKPEEKTLDQKLKDSKVPVSIDQIQDYLRSKGQLRLTEKLLENSDMVKSVSENILSIANATADWLDSMENK